MLFIRSTFEGGFRRSAFQIPRDFSIKVITDLGEIKWKERDTAMRVYVFERKSSLDFDFRCRLVAVVCKGVLVFLCFRVISERYIVCNLIIFFCYTTSKFSLPRFLFCTVLWTDKDYFHRIVRSASLMLYLHYDLMLGWSYILDAINEVFIERKSLALNYGKKVSRSCVIFLYYSPIYRNHINVYKMASIIVIIPIIKVRHFRYLSIKCITWFWQYMKKKKQYALLLFSAFTFWDTK